MKRHQSSASVLSKKRPRKQKTTSNRAAIKFHEPVRPKLLQKYLRVIKWTLANKLLFKKVLETTRNSKEQSFCIDSSSSSWDEDDEQKIFVDNENIAKKDDMIHILKHIHKYPAFDEIYGELDVEDSDEADIDEYDDDRELSSSESDGLMRDILNILGDVPDMDDISTVSSFSIYPLNAIQSEGIEIKTSKDYGRFVDPLTGGSLKSSSTEGEFASMHIFESEPLGEEELEVIVEEEEEEEEGPEQDLDLLLFTEMDDDMLYLKQRTMTKTELDLFRDIQMKLDLQAGKQVDWEAYQREEAKRLMHDNINAFIQEIFDRVVDYCEYVDANVVLRNHVNKEQVIKELKVFLDELDIEQRTCMFLNRKAVEFYRRKREYRHLIEDHPKIILNNMERLKETMYYLDSQLEKEATTKKASEEKVVELQNTIKELEDKLADEVHIFEETVCTAFKVESSPKMKTFIENQLIKMSKMRQEISRIRLHLIQKQHIKATLEEKVEALEHLGEGMRLRDYEQLRTAAQSLSKKIEERNNELNKYRLRFRAELHMITHVKEKQQMMCNTLNIQHSALKELINERYTLRQRIHDLKRERDKRRKEISELSFSGGLLDKPVLMLDYDKTVEDVQKMHKKVEYLKNFYEDLVRKVEEIESKCDNVGN